MHGIILAAGEGQRLRPLTTYYPKPMLPVGNLPILQFVIDSLKKNGIVDVIIVVGYQREKIMRYFGDGRKFGVSIRYAFQEKLLGTAHALYQAGRIEDFIVLPGDNIVDEKCINAIRDERNVILTAISESPSKYGVVEIDGERVKIVEKPLMSGRGQVFTGIGHFSGEIFNLIEENLKRGVYDLPEVLNSMESLRAKTSECTWKDAVYPWDLISLNWSVLKNVAREMAGKIEDATIIGNVEIGEGTRIGANCYIRGPVRIGRNCTIGANSVIMPSTSIGDGVSIGALSYIENSIIMKNTFIDAGAKIRNSVVGRNVQMGMNTAILSSDFRRIINGEIIERNDSGVIVGDNVIIGSGAVISAGTLIGADARIGELKRINFDVENGADVM